jgi:hypothetical protein
MKTAITALWLAGFELRLHQNICRRSQNQIVSNTTFTFCGAVNYTFLHLDLQFTLNLLPRQRKGDCIETDWGTMLLVGRSRVRVIWFFSSLNPSSRTMALGSTRLLAGINIRKRLGGKGRPSRKAENPTAICKPIVLTMWAEPRLPSCLVTGCYIMSEAM